MRQKVFLNEVSLNNRIVPLHPIKLFPNLTCFFLIPEEILFPNAGSRMVFSTTLPNSKIRK